MLFGETHKLSERNVYRKIISGKVWHGSYKNAFLTIFKKHHSCKFSWKEWKSVARLLQEFCEIYFQFTNLPSYVIWTRICKSCIDCNNFATFLLKLFFLWTPIVSESRVKTFQSGRFWFQSFTTRTILDWKKIQRVRFWIKNFTMRQTFKQYIFLKSMILKKSKF